MNDALISVREPYISRILEGTKTIEVRTQPITKIDRGSTIFFAQPGTHGLIVGSAICSGVDIVTPSFAWEHYQKQMQIDKADFNTYTKGRDTIFLLFLILPHRYKTPIHINYFGMKRIPQSYCYL